MVSDEQKKKERLVVSFGNMISGFRFFIREEKVIRDMLDQDILNPKNKKLLVDVSFRLDQMKRNLDVFEATLTELVRK